MLFECHLASCMLTGPFVVEFIDHQDAILVTQADEVAAIGIVGGADMVHAKLLDEFQAFLDSLWIGCGTECSECVVVGIALQQHFVAVELQTEVGTELNSAETELVASLVGYRTVVLQQLCLHTI